MNSNPSMPPGAMPPGAMPPGAMPPGAPPMPGGPAAYNPMQMSSTTTMMGGRRRKGKKRGTRRHSGGQMKMPNAATMQGGQMKMPNTLTMQGGRRRRGKKSGTRRHSGGQMKMPNMQGGAMPAVGSKAQVWHGSARHTSGGLTKKDLMKHKGRIISKRKHALGKKALKNLVKAGYKAKKGTFKLFRRK